ncbi:MAG: hypothetical protein ACJ8GK_04655 [Luteimonas sp.]
MQPILRRIVLLLPLLALGCQRGPDAVASRPAGEYVAHDWVLPAAPGAAQPDLVATVDGRLLLSWIDSSVGRRKALQFAQFSDGHWQSAPRTIVVGDALIANAADTPHLAATADGALWVQWLQKTAAGEGNDLMLSRSADGGFNWSPPVRINTASDGAEHGFASLWPATRDRIGMAWLDGAAPMPMAMDEKTQHAPPRTRSTALRAAVFDMQLRGGDATTIDERACDCCQTGVVTAAHGPLLVYRDRNTDPQGQDIRDIAIVRAEGAHWSAPSSVHADGWKMSACPVNGPAIDAAEANVSVAWYTAAGDMPAVRIAHSGDGGARFDAPVDVERGAAVQGRVAVALDERQAWILWVSGAGAAQSLWLARYTPDLSRQLQRVRLGPLLARGPGAGYPQLVAHDGAAYVVWSDAAGGTAQLHGAVVAR